MNVKSFREDKLRMTTQTAFANLIGVEVSTVAKWEKTNSMSFQEIQQILEKTGVSYEEFIEWEKPSPKPLDIKDTWKTTDFTKRSLSDYIFNALGERKIPDEYRKKYVENLQKGITNISIKPKVALVGRSDTGKSTLINTLLGTDKMPVAWTPTTSIAVYIKHISDKPDFITEDVWIFTNQIGTENLWDARKLYDEAYCRSWKIGAGGIDILRSFGTRQGDNYDQEAGAAVVFLDAPILKNCDIVDLPGFGTETESDDNITFTAVQKADVVLYLSQANGFMRIEDITYLKRNIKELPIWEKKGQNNLKPLSNLFVIASQAHTINCGNKEQLKEILDTGCTNLWNSLPNDYWNNRKQLSGYSYDNNGFNELRSRFFAYTTDIPDICLPFNDALKEIVEVLPQIINEKAKDYVRNYIKARHPDLSNEMKKYEDLVDRRERYVVLLNKIKSNELSRIQNNERCKKEVRNEIDRLEKETIDEFSEYIAKTVNVDALMRLLKEKKVKNRKSDLEIFGSNLQSMIQEECEKIIEKKSEILSEIAKKYVSSFEKSILQPFGNSGIKVDFDAGWTFASALAALGAIGGFGTFLASSIYGAILFAGAGLSIGTSVWAGVFLTSSIFGPIGIALGLLIAASLGLVKLFTGGWQKSVAKKIVATFDENNFSEKFRDGIREYWDQTRKAFDEAASELDKEWENYVNSINKSANEYDVQELQMRIESLKCLSDFFENIPL